MNRRGRSLVVVGVAAAVLVAAGAVTLARSRASCGAEVTSQGADHSSSPFLDAAGRAQQPDRQRDTLVAALAAAPSPFGQVLGAAGYHYEQWAQVSAFAQGLGVRTRDNPDFTLLDDRTLRPRWSVAVTTSHSAYDASDRDYVVATMPRSAPPDLVELDAGTGHRRWCSSLGGRAVGPDDAYATQLLDDGGLVVLTRGDGSRQRVLRLAGNDGHHLWDRGIDAGDGDFLGSLGGGLVLAGGSRPERLADPRALAARPSGQALVGLATSSGKQRWAWRSPARSGVHVLGTDPGSGLAVIEQWTAGQPPGRVFALDRSGAEAWSVHPAEPGFFDATLRSGRVLVRAGTTWTAYDAGDGRRLWQRTMPDHPQFLPYGFRLDDVPLLDPDHALLGTTTALRTLDLRDGSMTSAALPTDGISTTYWPYQVAVTDGLIAVATNTGAVVVRHEAVPGRG